MSLAMRQEKFHTTKDTRYSSDYTSTDDWELSIPFKPSFLLSQIIGYPKSILYDGICDSIDQSNVGDGSFSVLTKHMQTNVNPASTGTNKVQMSSHSDILPEKDLPSDDTIVAHQNL
ncbi:hypothetical protein H5410_061949 [Solanum commersonii]|uniref:Uncharacterized protein n=1 Tax=Solanum commersonii TaxID=4109 RepID=A0A9J5WA32_SOLCO|nr:hypothetical protein H5410_061949 [Solanum commersonii]